MAQISITVRSYDGRIKFNDCFRGKRYGGEPYDLYLIRNRDYGTFWVIHDPGDGFADLAFTKATKKEISVGIRDKLHIKVS